MRKALLVPLLVVSLFVCAQTPNDNHGNLPQIIPPSPDVASLVKVGSTSTSLHTGAANVNIPLYEIKVGSLTVPLALSYSSNGTRVNDISSRVGLGWNLIAGGSISRVVHDEEDDGANTIQLAPVSFNPPTSASYTYVYNSDVEHYDTEADEYSFSVNGLSGKFFFDGSGVIRVVEHSNIKITKQSNSFTLTGPDGTKYEFGKNLEIEKTRDVKTNGNQRAHKVKTTAWFLTRIISATGDQIDFTYNSIYVKNAMGPYQTVLLKAYQQTSLPVPPCSDGCENLCDGQWSPVGFNRLDYDTYYLSQITTSNGQAIYLTYQDSPDLSGNNRLTGVNVYTTNDVPLGKLVKQYQLEYQDYTVGTDLNQRFYLTKLHNINTADPLQKLTHQFTYNDPSQLPSIESYGQDYYGFSQGPTTYNTNFFPRPVDYNNYENGYMGADRTPNLDGPKAGTLQKVTYPTGGYEEFIYEQHTLPKSTTTYDTTYSTTSISGIGLNYNSMNTYTQAFTISSNPVKITHTTEWNPNGPAIGSPGYYTPDNIHFIAYFEIWDLSTNTKVYESRHKIYETIENYVTLTPGTNYELRLKVVGDSHYSFANIKYDPIGTSNTTWSNVDACGLRVKNINAYDPVSNKTTRRFFTYGNINNTGISSGVGLLDPSFADMYQNGGICHWGPCGNTIGGEILFICPEGWRLKQMSSSSVNGNFTFSGSPVAYQYVIESDDENLANGGIQHQFFSYYNVVQTSLVSGTLIPGAGTTSMNPDMNGTEISTKVYKKQGSSFVLLRQTDNNYSYDGRVYASRISYVTRKRHETISEPVVLPMWTWEDKLKPFDVNSYGFSTRWMHLDNSVVTEYDQNGQNPMTKTVTYSYANTDHLQPTQIDQTNSKNEAIQQLLKYPADYSDPVSTALIAKNIITPVIETSTSNNGSPVSKIKTEYGSWQSGAFYLPQLAKTAKASNALETRLRYYAYDVDGNPLEVSKEDGMHISYIWNYQKTYPIAEVKNAAVGNIAYTSFEGDENGNWSFNRNDIHTGGFTGTRGFTGVLTFAPATSGSYMVTLWSSGSTCTVNGGAGTLLTTRNGWNLYSWSLTGGLITVEGTNIDEVRLHPVGAMMMSYTYDPFIGVTTANDANNTVLYYFYDGFNRLWLIRDMDQNIVKQYEYKYDQPITPCGNTTANWQATGLTRCVIGSVINNNYTGEQEAQQRDNNNCSPTYLQLRWVSLGITGQCTPIPNCTGPDKRVVNGVCETAKKILISSVKTGRSTWECTFKYVWTDGYQSHQFIETWSTPCIGDFIE